METSKKNIVFLSICSALLAGCAQPVRVSDSLRLKDDDGVIVYRMNCGEQVAYANFYRSGVGSVSSVLGWGRAGALLCQEGVQTQRLQAGRYYIGQIGYTSWVDIAEPAAMSFTVTPGKLNYIGHIGLPSSVTKAHGRNFVSISDPFVRNRRTEAQDWLTAKQPSLKQRYEFVDTLAQPPVRIGKQSTQPDNSEPGQPEAAAAGTTVMEVTVLLELLIATDGSVKEGRIAKSSGHPSLDESALKEAIRNWKIAPLVENGAPLERWGNFQMTYRLVD